MGKLYGKPVTPLYLKNSIVVDASLNTLGYYQGDQRG